MAEKLCNRATTLLALSIPDLVETSVTVVGPADFPSSGNFRIRIENELMLVTTGGNASTNWIVTRAIEGTHASLHPAGAKVWAVLTAGSLTQYIQENGGSQYSSGTNWRSAAGAPSDSLGVNGDFYIDTDTGDVYKRVIGEYSLQLNILGPAGSAGADGATGSATVWRSGSGEPSTGADGDYYLKTSNGDVYVRASGSYSVVGNILGATGAVGTDGATWRTGSGAPSDGTGVNGDLYLRTSNGAVYLRSGGTYSVVLNITGPTGATGAAGVDGFTWRTGSGAPSDGTGVDGDLYFRTSNNNVYLRSSGTYSSIADLTGATGATGDDGDPGNVWRTGTGTPSDGDGSIDGDLYLETILGDVYQKISGSYSIVATIMGPEGDAGVVGSVWRNGSGVPSDAVGVDGDYYLDNDTGKVYWRASGTYSIVANIAGAKWYTDSGAPSDGDGVNGDFYLDTANGDVYTKAAGTWGSPTSNITGPPGDNGDDGAPGSVWRDGSGVPSDGTGIDGDYYLRTSNGNVYLRSSGTYSIVGNILGPTGSTGSTGSTGATGAAGSVWRSGSGVPSNGTGIDGDYYLRTSNGDVYTRSGGTYSVTGNILGPTGATGATGSAGSGREYTWCLGMQTACQVITGATNYLYINTNATIQRVSMIARTAPTGASFIIDILYSSNQGSTWTSIWTTTPNRLALATTVTYNTTTTFDNTALTSGMWLRIDIIQIGSTVPGQDITVQLAT